MKMQNYIEIIVRLPSIGATVQMLLNYMGQFSGHNSKELLNINDLCFTLMFHADVLPTPTQRKQMEDIALAHLFCHSYSRAGVLHTCFIQEPY